MNDTNELNILNCKKEFNKLKTTEQKEIYVDKICTYISNTRKYQLTCYEISALFVLCRHIRQLDEELSKKIMHEYACATFHSYNEASDILVNAVLHRFDLQEKLKEFEQLKLNRKNGESTDEDKLNAETKFVKELKEQSKLYYEFLDCYFKTFIKEATNEGKTIYKCDLSKYCKACQDIDAFILALDNKKYKGIDTFNLLLDYIEYQLHYVQEDNVIKPILNFLYSQKFTFDLTKDEKDQDKRTTDEQLDRITLKLLSVGYSKFKIQDEYQKRVIQDTDPVDEIKGIIRELENADSVNREDVISQFNICLNLLSEQNKLIEINYNDKNNIIHHIIGCAMKLSDTENDRNKFLVYKEFIEIIFNKLEFDSLYKLLKHKNSDGNTVHDLFFKMAHTGSNVRQWNRKGIELMDIMLCYSTRINIKCTNFWWSTFCNLGLLFVFELGFGLLNKVVYTEDGKKTLSNIHKGFYAWLCIKTGMEDAERAKERLKEDCNTGYSEANSWDVSNTVFIGVFGYLESYFSFFPHTGESLKQAFQNNVCGFSKLENGVFEASGFKKKFQGMNEHDKKLAYKALYYRKEVLELEQESCYLWSSKSKNEVLSKIQDCLKCIEDCKFELNSKQSFKQHIEQRFALKAIEVKTSTTKKLIDATSTAFSSAANTIGFKTTTAGIKNSIIDTIAIGCGMFVNGVKYFGFC